MKQLLILLSLILSLSVNVSAQTNTPTELEKQGQDFLKQKEFVKARYFYLQAYRAYANQGNTEKTISCGVQTAKLYARENLYKEAFDICNTMDKIVYSIEQKSGKSLFGLRYYVDKMRFDMYLAMRRPQTTKEYLDKLKAEAASSQTDSIKADYLYSETFYNYTFGQQQAGDNSFNTLVSEYKKQKEYSKVTDAYKNLISIAKRSNNSGMVAQTYDKYIAWLNTARTLTAKDELSKMEQKYDESQQELDKKQQTITAKNILMITLVIIIALLVAALVFGGIVLGRYMLQNRKQKQAIQVANEHNELKTKFIQNISAQMAPTLDSMDAKNQGVVALKGFTEHIQEMGDLESSLTELYETHEISDVNTFSEDVMDKIKDTVKPGVTTRVDVPKLAVSVNKEQTERVLLHLLNNASEHTPEGGKITLEFKRRGAHTDQFVVTNTGEMIPEELQENLFKPFSTVRNLTEGDGLGLPICALIATKLNGGLTLDNTYTKGARFILELHR